jgi:hypothetical protein
MLLTLKNLQRLKLKLALGAFCFLFPVLMFAQTKESWSNNSISAESIVNQHGWVPIQYRTQALNLSAIKNSLLSAANFQTPGAVPIALELPMPDGSFASFALFEIPLMHPDLQAKFPNIKTFGGNGIEHPLWSVRCDYTQFGFHAYITTEQGVVIIDPMSLTNTNDYLIYFKHQSGKQPTMVCELDESKIIDQIDKGNDNQQKISTASSLRTYRLALAATGEYTAYYGGTVAGGMAGIVTSVNRVDGIYMRELDVHMVLVANNDLLVYTNASTDPYTNSSGSTMLGQNQTNVTTVIGSANYDIGHVFSTGGGGIAGLGVVCSSTNKARGVTGRGAPIGDPFDVDYVAHEMGHQFAGNHTFNSVTSSCNGNRSASHAYEPGSGITIQAYAGICGADNLAPNSIANFHTHSFDEMYTFTTTGNGNTCPVITSLSNNAPVINSITSTKYIPYLTAFKLIATGSDPNGHAINYSWEQYDLGPSGTWNAPSGNAPIYRSNVPSASGERIFPKLSNILSNTVSAGEIYPTYARNMQFRVTLRDEINTGGGVTYNDTPVLIQVVNVADTFKVTYPNNSGINFQGVTCPTVTWKVANTTLAPISCPSVNILLSVDGGNTFPYTLASQVPNTGSYTVSFPAGVTTTTGRIMVESSNNIFFDINNNNFTISNPLSISGNTPFCQGSSITLNAGSGYSTYQWSTGANTQTIAVNTAGTYSVTVTTAGGCLGTASVTTSVFANPAPTITASGPTSFCQGGSVTFTSSGSFGNTWSTGATTQSIIVSVGGSYSVTTYNGNGCFATSLPMNVTVSSFPVASISALGPATFCQGGSVQLHALSAVSYLWSTGATTQNITVTQGGNYSVTVGNGTGCTTTSSPFTVTVNSNPTPTVNANGPLSFCGGGSVILSSSSSTGNAWSNGSNAQSITVTQAGNYAVTVTDGNGCSGTSANVVVAIQNCSGPSTQIRASDCGRTNFNLQSSIVADLVSGATQYEFQFRDAADVNIVATKIQTSRTLAIASVTPALQWGTNYMVRVRPIISGTPGSFGNPCVIGFVPDPAIFDVPATQLNTASCGKLNNILSSSSITANVVNGATQYEFEFRNVSNNALVATKIQTNNFTTLSSVTPALQWGTQYNVRVRAYYGTFAGNYSTVCIIGIIPDPATAGVPNTQLSTASCGNLNLALTGNITCIAVSGANQYEWEFRNPSTSALVATKTTTNTSLTLSTVTPSLQWGTQYNVRVRAFISTTGGTFSTVCLIGLMVDPAIGGVPTTRLNSMNCGNVNLTQSSSIVALTVSGASQYEFEFSNPSNSIVYATKTSTSATLFLSNVTPTLQWGTQYNVRVRAYIGTTAGTYGNICLIGTIADPALGVPATQLRSVDCGKLNFTLTSNMAANPVAGATQYEFEFSDVNTLAVVATRLQTSATLNIANVVPALQAGMQYNVRVRAYINTFVGNYGAVCLIGIANGARFGAQDAAEEERSESNELSSIQVSPNPTEGNANLLISSSKNEMAQLSVSDLSGRLMSRESINTNTNVMIGETLETGVYLLVAITQSGEKVYGRLIKK